MQTDGWTTDAEAGGSLAPARLTLLRGAGGASEQSSLSRPNLLATVDSPSTMVKVTLLL